MFTDVRVRLSVRGGGRAHYGAHIQFAIYLEMDLSHYLAEREK